MLQLYSYFRSSASYRVRIALNLKGLPFEYVPVHLLKDGGQQHTAEYQRINPAELVPTLVDDGQAIGQSLAIMEYLDETRPELPALLPRDALGRARVRALAQAIACEIHPLNNLRVLQYLEKDLKLDETTKATWYRHWITVGFTAVEALLANNPHTGAFCHGDTPGLADCCLIPQIANSRRFETPLDAFPTIRRIETACLALDAFVKAAPALQPDAV
ncbi:maleylacetoacetate isomerase [Rhodoferax sp. AJA081-3]|uniref:maleylacetoacetate isomerase n=1 Tax=Rhodoferax sp. AJA081-3 TaxID=2752316 RepID=UPI001ADEEB0F|nr:maleylacetoacetate isomerase [Rhodoferax sp. AJA081-3]QTN28817.1 maleylacetoacetate isomerase [Rhodoferax sp. AJA081-3]